MRRMSNATMRTRQAITMIGIGLSILTVGPALADGPVSHPSKDLPRPKGPRQPVPTAIIDLDNPAPAEAATPGLSMDRDPAPQLDKPASTATLPQGKPLASTEPLLKAAGGAVPAELLEKIPPEGVAHEMLPDLVVSDLFLVDDEIRFKVKNVGEGAKRPAEINYHLTMKYPGQGIPDGQNKGVAGMTSLARLRPGEETAEDRVTHYRPQLRSRMVITLCVNDVSQIPESKFDNNCLTRDARTLLSDLTITQARINLVYFKEPEKGLLESLGELVGDALCPSSLGVDFDEGGVNMNVARITVTNSGAVPVTNFDVAVVSGGGLIEKGTWKKRVTKLIEPGRSSQVDISVGRGQCKPGKCKSSVRAEVDLDNKVLEFMENNNSQKVTTVVVRDHSSGGGVTVYGNCN